MEHSRHAIIIPVEKQNTYIQLDALGRGRCSSRELKVSRELLLKVSLEQVISSLGFHNYLTHCVK